MRFVGFTCIQCSKRDWDGVCFKLEVDSDDEETDGEEYRLCSPECVIAFVSENSVMASPQQPSIAGAEATGHNAEYFCVRCGGARPSERPLLCPLCIYQAAGI